MQNYRWYAVYTHANKERELVNYLTHKLETYLPLRTYSDFSDSKFRQRREPLFRHHVFVRSLPENLHWVKSAPQFSHFIKFGNYLASFTQNQIIKIDMVLRHFEETTAIENNLTNGVTVAVINGPLKGLTGMYIEVDGNKLVAIDVGQLGLSMLVTLPPKSFVRTEFETFA